MRTNVPVTFPGVFSEEGNVTDPDGNSGEQMAECVSMPVPCQGLQGSAHLVRKQRSSKWAS